MITLTLRLPNFCSFVKIFKKDDLVKGSNLQYLASTLIIAMVIITALLPC